jgi:hypothetical protein
MQTKKKKIRFLDGSALTCGALAHEPEQKSMSREKHRRRKSKTWTGT